MSYDAVQQSRSNEKRVLLGYNANANAVVIALDMMCMAWKKRCELLVSASSFLITAMHLYLIACFYYPSTRIELICQVSLSSEGILCT